MPNFSQLSLDAEAGLASVSNAMRPVALAVDDDKDNLQLLQHVLAGLDCTILLARTGRAALELARRHRPHLLVLDLRLPDLDGCDVLAELQQDPATRHIPAIAVTARVESEASATAAGARKFVAKPYRLEELEVAICALLGRGRATDAG